MKTEFQTETHRYEPQPMVHYTGADGQARLMRPWKKYEFRGNGQGTYFWVYVGTKFHPLRATKLIISQY
jgi:hypothetical protein